jgi:hypothetical protein
MTTQHHAEILQIFCGRLRQRLPVVLAKRWLVSLEAETLQPFGHINRHFLLLDLAQVV